MERFHWFFCGYVLICLGLTLLGRVIMVVGPILKSKAFASSSDSAESSELLSSEACDLSVSSYEALGPTFTALSVRTQDQWQFDEPLPPGERHRCRSSGVGGRAEDFCSRTTSATPEHGTAVSDAVLIEPKLRQIAARPCGEDFWISWC